MAIDPEAAVGACCDAVIALVRGGPFSSVGDLVGGAVPPARRFADGVGILLATIQPASACLAIARPALEICSELQSSAFPVPVDATDGMILII